MKKISQILGSAVMCGVLFVGVANASELFNDFKKEYDEYKSGVKVLIRKAKNA